MNAISQQKIFLGKTASASVQTEQQLWQDTRRTFKLKYSKLVPTWTLYIVSFIEML
jgi:hypothetical protein